MARIARFFLYELRELEKGLFAPNFQYKKKHFLVVYTLPFHDAVFYTFSVTVKTKNFWWKWNLDTNIFPCQIPVKKYWCEPSLISLPYFRCSTNLDSDPVSWHGLHLTCKVFTDDYTIWGKLVRAFPDVLKNASFFNITITGKIVILTIRLKQWYSSNLTKKQPKSR